MPPTPGGRIFKIFLPKSAGFGPQEGSQRVRTAISCKFPVSILEIFHLVPKMTLYPTSRGLPGGPRDLLEVPTSWEVPGTSREVPGTSWEVLGTSREVAGTSWEVPGTSRDKPVAGFGTRNR